MMQIACRGGAGAVIMHSKTHPYTPIYILEQVNQVLSAAKLGALRVRYSELHWITSFLFVSCDEVNKEALTHSPQNLEAPSFLHHCLFNALAATGGGKVPVFSDVLQTAVPVLWESSDSQCPAKALASAAVTVTSTRGPAWRRDNKLPVSLYRNRLPCQHTSARYTADISPPIS